MRDFRLGLQRLFNPIDIMPLVLFRVAFGGIMVWEVWRYFHFDRVYRYYIEPIFTFHYYGFHWLNPLPGDGMVWLFYGLAALSICILLGLFYRAVMPLFWLVFTYIFLLDETQYLNHFYLISLISFLLIFVPAHRKWSLDSLLFPKIHSETAPLWSLWLLRGQMAIVYIYGGIAKINPDWLRGEPMRDWLSSRTDFPLIGQYFTEEWMVYAFSYGGLLLDLLVVPFLLWKRTRIPALLVAIVFHLTNARLFNIGIFPWFAIAATLLFLPPHWFRFRSRRMETMVKTQTIHLRERLLLLGIACYFLIQILLPLRHFLYADYVSWTEDGHTLAWHMKLRSKDGTIALYASHPDTGITEIIPLEDYLNRRQTSQMSDNPHMILRFVHYLSETDAYAGQEIRAWSMMSLNGRASQLLIDPTANLVEEVDDLWRDDWVLPLLQAPAPDTGTPTLLISRRVNGVLIFINITEQAFPLENLELRFGDITLSGATIGLSELEADGCFVAHHEQADMATVFPICNEDSNRMSLALDMAWQNLSMTVTAPYEIECSPEYCLVTYIAD